jgi:glycolate oxidase
MEFKKISEQDVHFFQSLKDVRVLTDSEALNICASDETEDLHYLPEIVIQPETVAAVSAVMAYCNEHNIPVTPRGAGTGLSGGALPVFGGVYEAV